MVRLGPLTIGLPEIAITAAFVLPLIGAGLPPALKLVRDPIGAVTSLLGGLGGALATPTHETLLAVGETTLAPGRFLVEGAQAIGAGISGAIEGATGVKEDMPTTVIKKKYTGLSEAELAERAILESQYVYAIQPAYDPRNIEVFYGPEDVSPGRLGLDPAFRFGLMGGLGR